MASVTPTPRLASVVDQAALPEISSFRRILIKVGSSLLVDRDQGRVKRDWLAALAGRYRRTAWRRRRYSRRFFGLGRPGPPGSGLPGRRLEARRQPGCRGRRADRVRPASGPKSWPRARSRPARSSSPSLIRKSAAAISTHAPPSPACSISARSPSSTRTIRWRRARSAMATTIDWRPASPLWPAPICSSCFQMLPGFIRRRRTRTREPKLIPVVPRVTAEIEAMAGGAASPLARGGMRTKIEAAQDRRDRRHPYGHRRWPRRPSAGAAQGGLRLRTWFLTGANPVTARKKWIAGSIRPRGALHVDAGAARSDRRRRQLCCRQVCAALKAISPAAIASSSAMSKAARSAAASLPMTPATRRRSPGAIHATSNSCSACPAAPEIIHRDDMVLAGD